MQIFTDKWFTPVIKLVIDQTAWAVTWNSLYYCLLGEHDQLLLPLSHLEGLDEIALQRTAGSIWDCTLSRRSCAFSTGVSCCPFDKRKPHCLHWQGLLQSQWF